MKNFATKVTAMLSIAMLCTASFLPLKATGEASNPGGCRTKLGFVDGNLSFLCLLSDTGISCSPCGAIEEVPKPPTGN